MKKKKYPNRSKKIKEVGLLEKSKMKRAGRSDGKRGLPRKCEDGIWTSPFLQKEMHAYDEYATRMWCDCQMLEETEYARLHMLIDSVLQKKEQLRKEMNNLVAAETQEDALCTLRKIGESSLTDDQVASRRKRESEKKLAPMRIRISTIECEIDKLCTECSDVYNRMIETHNTTRMVCQETKDHVLQRIAVYWNSMLKKHPDKDKMPVVPTFELTSRSEDAYMSLHERLIHKADELIKSISNNNEEEAAA